MYKAEIKHFIYYNLTEEDLQDLVPGKKITVPVSGVGVYRGTVERVTMPIGFKGVYEPPADSRRVSVVVEHLVRSEEGTE